ncbi:MAG TPA: 5'-nucleotidase C-terminal domain-containing protein [Polyangiaceae bacterium]|jgi:5'-nucleotidase|nr:MAG: Trifunctional nucleotide phosphoesterase protein YfkN precursor [Deltaproteobacteria bacterium ADurb.Bin207]HNS97650.1 5'-nucleotidase C-terminal domain-containing protein [Polyangiaceae bacterium]HNZ21084.1 5'-nucleotidase C-terminal domain-containing protein [Polyangiaceae bacterium]HOD22291.1 5'-nucleotidase C-terminal domain-containing protein [Polyangiaceae bacterium]HOE47854.1 5'-nucleotidase C-terminal domain-containing protein [Polyangiaceae bacterium]
MNRKYGWLSHFRRLGYLLLSGLIACGGNNSTSPSGSGQEDGADDTFWVDGKADVGGIAEGSAEACGVLAVANDSTFEQLKTDVGLSVKAAKNIVAYRQGSDGTLGTGDDGYFDSLDELDKVKYVGPVAFSKLATYAKGHDKACKIVDLQFISLSDFHGQLDPITVAEVGKVGGAAALNYYFVKDRVANPRSLLLSAGDSFGASPPIAAFFDERPVIEAMNRMRFDGEAPGNHSFDRGVPALQELIELADFPFVSANLTGVEDSMACETKPDKLCIAPYQNYWVGGVKVAVIGLLTPEAPSLVKPGSFASIEVTDPAASAQAAKAKAAAEGASVFVALTHIGGSPGAGGAAPTGPLMELAEQLDGFDLLIGGHTHNAIETTVGNLLVVENPSQGAKYSRVALSFDFAQRKVVHKTSEMLTPVVEGTVPDPAFDEFMAHYRTQLAQQLDLPLAVAEGIFERGNNVERLQEVALGNLLTDALRARYQTDLALVNGGGLRAPMPSSYAPANLSLRRPSPDYQAGPPFDLVVGDVFAVLPFVNDAAICTLTGKQVWAMLEHGLGFLPAPNGGFPQVSGITVTFDSAAPAGNRVISIVLDNKTAIDKNDTTYSLVTSDFMYLGGDGYSMLSQADGYVADRLTDVLADYIEAVGTIAPTINGRLVDVASP